jgi:ABC-type transport system substrate-binding protein
MDPRGRFRYADRATTGATMRRRQFLATATAARTSPAIARRANTLRIIPEGDPPILDPVFTTATVVRNHGYLVFDTLYGTDDQYRIQPRMLAGHVTEDDGKRWVLTLREGLTFHDNTPVLARDCVASIRRYRARDALGQALMETTDELSALDDKRIQFRLKKPFPPLPNALGKAATPMPCIMPERLALTDPNRQVTEMIGSGPFRFVASERVVMLGASDYASINAQSQVGAALLRKIGMNVDLRQTDWGTTVRRRGNRKPPAEGGWSIFYSNISGVNNFDPAGHLGLRGNGAGAWFGWPNSPRIEAPRTEFLFAPDVETRRRICEDIQRQAFIDVPYVPLGAQYQPTAFNKAITPPRIGFPQFYDIRRV